MTTTKIHFTSSNIRKVSLTDELETFDSFTQFLTETYNQVILDRPYLIQYVDEDQDTISVSSQLEWEEMIRNQTGKVAVYIVIEGNKNRIFGEHRFHGRCGRGRFGRGRFQRKCKGKNGEVFDPKKKYFWLQSKALRLMEQGDQKSLQTARHLLLKALYFVPDAPNALYNLACVESLSGNVSDAVDTLKQAIQAGWRDIQHTIADPDFQNIKDSEGFQECIVMLSQTPEPEASPEQTPEQTPEQIPEPTPEVTSEPIPEPTVEQSPEDPLASLKAQLSEMGISLDDTTVSELALRFSNNLTEIINHYFRSLN